LLTNPPTPTVSDVLLFDTVGFALVLQHTPHAVIELPPSEVTLPPLSALLRVIVLIVFVVSVGASPPGPVPESLHDTQRIHSGINATIIRVLLTRKPIIVPSR